MTTLPQNIAIDFTDEQITPAAGSLFVSRVAGRLVRHARQWTLKLSKNAHRLDWLIHAADRADAWKLAPT